MAAVVVPSPAPAQFPFPAIDRLQLSHSTAEAYDSCARKLEFRKLYQSSYWSDSQAADAGTALHHSWYKYLTSGGNVQEAVAQLALDYPIQYQQSPFQTRSLEACYSTLMAAIESNSLPGYELATIIHNGEEKPAIEIPFQINIKNFTLPHPEMSDGIPITWVGYIDLILHDIMQDRYVVLDIKSTRDDMPDYTPKFRWDSQCTPYGMVLERILNRPIDNFEVIYWVWYIDMLEPRIEAYPFMKDQTDVQEWAQALTVRLMTIKLYWELGWFPRNGKACRAFNRVCPHYDYCESRDRSFIEAMLEQTSLKDERPPFEHWFELDFELEGL